MLLSHSVNPTQPLTPCRLKTCWNKTRQICNRECLQPDFHCHTISLIHSDEDKRLCWESSHAEVLFRLIGLNILWLWDNSQDIAQACVIVCWCTLCISCQVLEGVCEFNSWTHFSRLSCPANSYFNFICSSCIISFLLLLLNLCNMCNG